MKINIEYANFTPTQKLTFFIDALLLTHPLFQVKHLGEISLTLTQKKNDTFQAKIKTTNLTNDSFICAESHKLPGDAYQNILQKSYTILKG